MEHLIERVKDQLDAIQPTLGAALVLDYQKMSRSRDRLESKVIQWVKEYGESLGECCVYCGEPLKRISCCGERHTEEMYELDGVLVGDESGILDI